MWLTDILIRSRLCRNAHPQAHGQPASNPADSVIGYASKWDTSIIGFLANATNDVRQTVLPWTLLS